MASDATSAPGVVADDAPELPLPDPHPQCTYEIEWRMTGKLRVVARSGPEAHEKAILLSEPRLVLFSDDIDLEMDEPKLKEEPAKP